MKNCPPRVKEIIAKFFNIVLNTGYIPEVWCIGIIMPLYKNKGERSQPDNYRGITLLSCMGKLFTAILNFRLTNYLEATGTIGDEQAGFRQEFSTVDHIFSLHMMINFYLKKGKRLYVAFIDYRKAFDFVDRVLLWNEIITNGINGNFLRIIYNLYDKAKSCVKTDGRTSALFSCNTGVRQGENLSPILFSIFLNDFERHISKYYDGLSDVSDAAKECLSDDDVEYFVRLYALLYADDTIVMAENETELQKGLSAVYSYCTDWNLQVNTDKTKVVIFSNGKVTKYPTFLFGHSKVDVVEDYVYLGVLFHRTGSFQKAIMKQIKQATKSFHTLMTKVRYLHLPVDLTLELFQQLVVPVLLYGSEVWGASNIEQIDVFQRKCLKQILGVKTLTPSVMVYGETGNVPVSELVKLRMINYFMLLCNGKKTKISYIIYKIWRCKMNNQMNYTSDWITVLKSNLSNFGMHHIWEFEGNGFTNEYVKQSTKLRMKDIYLQKWNNDVNGHELCDNYKMFKTEFRLEKYLTHLNFYERLIMSKFRCRSNLLPVTYNRLNNRSYEDQQCPLCNDGENGDEFHYLFMCSHFEEERSIFLPDHFIRGTPDDYMKNLLQSEEKGILKNLVKFMEIIINTFDDDPATIFY